MKELLFQITKGDKEYKIYTNGEIEGFPEGCEIVNNFPVLLLKAPTPPILIKKWIGDKPLDMCELLGERRYKIIDGKPYEIRHIS